MMRVLYLSDAFAAKERFGLARYAWALYDALRETAPEIKLSPLALQVGAAGATRERIAQEYGLRKLPGPRKLWAGLWAGLQAPPVEWFAGPADVVHSVELGYPVATRRPWVATIHDIGPLTHPEFFSASRPWLKDRALRLAARHADALIAVSEATADAVEGYLGTSLGDRLHVIPEGVEEVFFADEPPIRLRHLDALGDAPFFLWTGSLNPRKNLDRVLDAFESVAPDLPHHLVLVGGMGWDTEPIMERLQQSPVAARIHRPGYVTDRQLRALYRRATAFVYVSLMEGFGLPILEAMACGCPVITSSVSSMPEVAGEAAVLVDPTSSAAIAEALRAVAEDDALRCRLAEEGPVQADRFHWANTAEAVARLYQAVS